jgi:hypothetical protein
MSDRTCQKCLHVYKYPHMLKHHFETTYHCKKTNDEITEFFILNKVKKNDDLYKCSKCSKDFTNIKALNRHSKETLCGKSNISHVQSITSSTNTELNDNEINNDTTNNYNYIYLIEKFDVNNKEYIYEFGKSNRESSTKLKENENEEEKVLLIIDVDNCNISEKHILNILRNTAHIKQCVFGNEYFICNDKKYIINIILKNI